MTKNHADLYKTAELYDIAFDFRNVGAECDFLDNLALGTWAGPLRASSSWPPGPRATQENSRTGQTIQFFATDVITGQRAQIYEATTVDDGKATCSESLDTGIAAIRGMGYEAVYDGDGERYFGARDSAGLVTGVVTLP